MGSPFPSIQSFYQREIHSSPSTSSNHRSNGDGFTSSEVEAALNPLAAWAPTRKYEKCSIARLELGPRDYEITGRVVNFTTNSASKHQSQSNHEGACMLIVSDGTGGIAVKLLYNKSSDYCLLLGQRVTIWTGYISDAMKGDIGHIPFVQCATNIYPGRSGITHIMFHEDAPSSDADKSCRTPIALDSSLNDYLPGLMTLKSFLNGGNEVSDVKILVCVRSVGPRKTIRPRKREATVDLVEVGIFDDTASCVLKVWEDKIASAKIWVPNTTILLLSSPTYRATSEKSGSSGDVGIGYSSMVNVNPVFSEAEWLRKKAAKMTKKEKVLIPFPDGTWDVNVAMNGPVRELFTIAEVDDLVRQDFENEFTGKLNVIVLEMNLMDNWRQGTTCCFDCCGIPLYANRVTATCKNCKTVRELSLNPRVIGTLVDESGTIAAGKLVWSDDAWTQLLFGGPGNQKACGADNGDDYDVDLVEQAWEDLTTMDTVSLRDVEDQILFSRVTLTFGWSATLERLCILGVEW